MTRRAAVFVQGDGSVETKVTGKMARLFAGDLSVEDMDDEELFRMRFKNKNGKFIGPDNKVIPRDLAMAMQREMMKRGVDMLGANLLHAVERLLWLGSNAEDESVQLRANVYVVDRILGKTPDKVEISGDAPWQLILQKIIVTDEAASAAASAKPPARRQASQQTVSGKVVRDGRREP